MCEPFEKVGFCVFQSAVNLRHDLRAFLRKQQNQFVEEFLIAFDASQSGLNIQGGNSRRQNHECRQQRGQERTELYDLAGDPSEQRNLLENPDAVSQNGVGELQALLARFADKVSVASAVSVDVDQSTKERLRQLGY